MTDPVNDGAVTPTTLSIPVKDLTDAGLEAQWRSWIGSGPNEPVTAQQITLAVGQEELARTGDSLGLESGQVAAVLADALPRLISGSDTIDLRVELNDTVLTATPQVVVGEAESDVNFRAPLKISATGSNYAPGDYTGVVAITFDAVPPA
ncbi:CS1 type fimbrial major subunit (plasmid) [Embleya sp. NBC_00888]|uniref:CS1 type fimbrial major subunit n=1 Tax=Embleya sp. NBC_00888 TaxID=2975960 RepID=UPI002F9098FA|nr:CS1 type fimbrial major subunit [Embleya sp. NBC_00888]